VLRDKLSRNKIITLEILLPTSQDLENLLKTIEPLKDYIDAVNIPSNPLGKLRPDALCYGHIIQEKIGIEAIPHFVARHFTSLGFESHLLGAKALGIDNVLCITGDSPVGGRSSFELNSSKLLEIAINLRNGLTSARSSIGPIDFCLCTSFNPNVRNLRGEFIKTKEKCRCGAEVFFTQPIFNPDRFIEILKELRRNIKDAKVIAGLSFLYTKKRAFSLMKFLGVPYEYINLIENRDETEMLFETAAKLKDYVDGFYVIPIGKYPNAFELVKKIRAMI